LEGPLWLEHVIRKLATGPGTVRLITADEYLRQFPDAETVNPSLSSWGFQGYSETWLMGRNDWIYPAVYKAIEVFRGLIKQYRHHRGLQRAALNQYLRELLLAQSSDWPFIMHAETAMAYAMQRVRTHLANMNSIRLALETKQLELETIGAFQEQNNIFADVDLVECFLECR
jgi:1,4-alpha-glucan branching enzyme